MTGWRPAVPGDQAWDPRLVVRSSFVVRWRDPQAPWSAQDCDTRFRPDYGPDAMAQMGIFGDAYWGGAAGAERLRMLQWASSPIATRGGKAYTNIRGSQCRHINRFGRPASLDKDWWLDRGLICDLDPLGWYEWYCWYARGRRIDGYDEWQVGRWLNFKERHTAMYETSGRAAGHAQALLHWGIAVAR